MVRITLIAIALMLMTGCGSPEGDSGWTDHREASAIVYDPFEYNPRQQIAIFRLYQDQHYNGDGDPSWSETDITIQNISGYTISFNFIVSGPGWRFESAVVELPPNATVSFGQITHHFYALDNFWITVPDVIYSFSAAG